MGKMSGFVFQDEYLERLAMLSDQELGRLVRALVKYHMTGEVQELAGRESVAFGFIKFDIDRIDKAYQTKCETNRNNRQRSSTSVDDGGKNATKPNENDKDKDKDLKDTLSFDKERVQKSGKRFSPPTLEEVEEYCGLRNSSVVPEKFIDYYQSIGWKVGGKSQMKDWKAAVRNWEQMNRDKDAAAYDLPL